MKRESIEFVESRKPISGFVTKFGGQPVWMDKPQWPLSKSTGKPMMFIGQVAINPEMFEHIGARMAYVFMADDDEGYVDGTWEADGGENAVILQPGQTTVKTEPLAGGPSLYRMVKKLFHKQSVPESCEFSTILKPVEEDPDFVDEMDRLNWEETACESYIAKLEGNKIGGSPLFIQGTEFPGPGRWRLLLQIDSTKIPFHVNFGDAGVGYIFLSEDGQAAKFLWQCC